MVDEIADNNDQEIFVFPSIRAHAPLEKMLSTTRAESPIKTGQKSAFKTFASAGEAPSGWTGAATHKTV